MKWGRWGGYLLAGLVVAILLARGGWWGESPQVRVTTRLSMGTLVSISTWGVEAKPEAQAVGLAFDEMQRIEAEMSRFYPQSSVTQLNDAKRGEGVLVSAELGRLLSKGVEIEQLSGGAFSIGLSILSDLWGFSQEPSPVAPPASERIASWLAGYRQRVGSGIELNASTAGMLVRLTEATVGVDLGGIAKGYAVDQAAEVLRRQGVDNALINAGGDMRVLGSKGGVPWHIGVRDPRDHTGVVAVLDLAGSMALSTSGDYERFFMVDGVRYHHILDPKTGESARSGLMSVSVLAQNSMMADILSTTLFVLGEEAGLALLKQFPGCEALLVRQAGGHVQTSGFVGQWVKTP